MESVLSVGQRIKMLKTGFKSSALRVAQRQEINKMSLLNLATVFGPSLLRPPVAGLGHDGPKVDISQEVVIQVSF